MSEVAEVVEKESTEESNQNQQVIDVGKQDISQVLEKKKQVIKNTVAKDANKQEFEMFMHLAKTYQLDPFQKEIFFWKIKGQSTIMTSRDGYLKIANRHPKFDGLVSDVVHANDQFKKNVEGVEHSYSKDRGNIIGAYALVYRKDRSFPIYVFAPYNEYKANKKVWKQYPSAMILKCAESMALKRAFSVSGLVSKEEMEVQEAPIQDTTDYNSKGTGSKQPKDVTPNESEDISLTEAQNLYAKGKKFKGKKLKECPTSYLEWVAENWNEDKLRNAAKKIVEYRNKKDKSKSKKNNKKSKKEDGEEMTEREKEIAEFVKEDKSLKAVVLQYLNEYDCKSINGLDDELYEELVKTLVGMSGGEEENLAEEVAEEMEKDGEFDPDDYDTPF